MILQSGRFRDFEDSHAFFERMLDFGPGLPGPLVAPPDCGNCDRCGHPCIRDGGSGLDMAVSQLSLARASSRYTMAV